MTCEHSVKRHDSRAYRPRILVGCEVVSYGKLSAQFCAGQIYSCWWLSVGCVSKRAFEFKRLESCKPTLKQTGGAGVHAITSGNGKSYTYDAYGNIKTRGSQVLEYDVFNKPTRIDNTYFAYGPNHERFKQTNNRDGVTTYTIAGGQYEEVQQGGTTTQKSYVDGIYLETKVGSTRTANYLHQYHLGSTDVITNSSGAIKENLNFDAWGKRQESDWQFGDPTGGSALHFSTQLGLHRP